MKVYVEGKPDKSLIQSLQSALKSKDIIQAGTLSKVVSEAAIKPNIIGIIDEDPMGTHPTSMRFFVFEKSRKYQIDVYRHPQTNGKLIVLCPRLEEWIIYTCKAAQIDITSYNLPRNPSRLTDVINQRIDNLERLIEELLKQESKQLIYLQRLLSKQ